MADPITPDFKAFEQALRDRGVPEDEIPDMVKAQQTVAPVAPDVSSTPTPAPGQPSAFMKAVTAIGTPIDEAIQGAGHEVIGDALNAGKLFQRYAMPGSNFLPSIPGADKGEEWLRNLIPSPDTAAGKTGGFIGGMVPWLFGGPVGEGINAATKVATGGSKVLPFVAEHAGVGALGTKVQNPEAGPAEMGVGAALNTAIAPVAKLIGGWAKPTAGRSAQVAADVAELSAPVAEGGWGMRLRPGQVSDNELLRSVDRAMVDLPGTNILANNKEVQVAASKRLVKEMGADAMMNDPLVSQGVKDSLAKGDFGPSVVREIGEHFDRQYAAAKAAGIPIRVKAGVEAPLVAAQAQMEAIKKGTGTTLQPYINTALDDVATKRVLTPELLMQRRSEVNDAVQAAFKPGGNPADAQGLKVVRDHYDKLLKDYAGVDNSALNQKKAFYETLKDSVDPSTGEFSMRKFISSAAKNAKNIWGESGNATQEFARKLGVVQDAFPQSGTPARAAIMAAITNIPKAIGSIGATGGMALLPMLLGRGAGSAAQEVAGALLPAGIREYGSKFIKKGQEMLGGGSTPPTATAKKLKEDEINEMYKD